MGLDQYAGLRDSKGKVHEKFYWRKHARSQVFMSKQFNKQKNSTLDCRYQIQSRVVHQGQMKLVISARSFFTRNHISFNISW